MSQDKQSLGVVFFPAFDWAITPTHPEREERLLYTMDQLKEEGIFDIDGITEYRATHLDKQMIEEVHFCIPTVERVITESHLVSSGGAVTAARLVLEQKERKAFALVRPPGHHAMRVVHGNRGFCNINNEAIMIEWIRKHYYHPDGRPLRIAIVDTDVHHGDGTQDIFWNDPNTLFISIHQHGHTLYPGTGFLNENGGPGALGGIVNIPILPGTSDRGYIKIIKDCVMPILASFKPDLIINSAGQDNHFTDPLANEKLTAQGYATINRILDSDIAVLEGGYSVQGALPYVNMGICLALRGLSAEDIVEPDWEQADLTESDRVVDYTDRLCDEVLERYEKAAMLTPLGHEQDGFWVRDKQIFYDTDGIYERQQERYKLCTECNGFGIFETQSSLTALSYCVLLPQGACKHCQDMAHTSLELAQRSSRYTYIQCIDKTQDRPTLPWPLEAKEWH